MQERRASTRHPVALQGEMVANGVHRSITVLNLSLGGALASPLARTKHGSRVHLAFSIPTTQDPIIVGATVRWTDRSGTGLQFDDLGAEETSALRRYLEQLSD